jgi:hypothetical protein
VIIDQVAPDRHGVAAAGEGRLDHFAIRFARAGGGRPPWRGRRAQRAGDPWRTGSRVGGYLYGRICRGVAPPPPGAARRVRRPRGRRRPSRAAPVSPARCAGASSPAAQVPELAVSCCRSRCWSCWRGTTVPPAASTS